MFWTDAVQAQERLAGTFVCYDKKPVFIDRIEAKKSGVVAITYDAGEGDYRQRNLEDEKWNNFRDLPVLGWFNYINSSGNIVPYLLERRSVNTRSHGLSSSNTRLHVIAKDGVSKMERGFNLNDFFRNPGYMETYDDETSFPKLSEILMALDDNPGGVAFSRKLAVCVTEEGMKWLVHKNRRIGFFTGTDSLNLFPKNGFYKEELLACPNFDINNIREF